MLGLAAPRAHGQGRLSSSVRAAMTPTTAPFACYNGQVVLATGHPRPSSLTDLEPATGGAAWQTRLVPAPAVSRS
jgi:hypothetical protein